MTALEHSGTDSNDWFVLANCRGTNPDLFFPQRGAATEEAKRACAGCTVSVECLEYALSNRELQGIWGGTSERERRHIRRRRALMGRPV